MSTRFPQYANILRISGLLGAGILLAIFRRDTPSGPAWLDFSYPEILGLIALSYFASALLYIPTRHIRWMQPVWFVVLVALNAATFVPSLRFAIRLPLYIWPFGNGAMPSIIFAGILVSMLLFPAARNGETTRPRLALTVAFGLVMLAVGFLLTPLGISKIRATPTWCLYSAGAAAILLAVLYWLCDMKHRSGWAFLLQSAGSNGLLTYLLPDLWFYLSATIGFTWIDSHWTLGTPAVLKILAFTLVILFIARGLTRLRLRLQL
jgi:predicted acyltransferase